MRTERPTRDCIGALERINPALAASCSDHAALVYRAQREGAGTAPLLIRARYVEDALLQSLERGLRQYVIIGAGLDTFAWRRPDVADRLQVVEIDHPATQQFKRERLDAAGLLLPLHLHFAPADLEREPLSDVLARTPYDATLPAFFAWLGVTMYLSRNSIFETFRSISTVDVRGSELVFDYFEPAAFAANAPLRLRYMMQRVHESGEPMVSGLDPAILRSELLLLVLAWLKMSDRARRTNASLRRQTDFAPLNTGTWRAPSSVEAGRRTNRQGIPRNRPPLIAD